MGLIDAVFATDEQGGFGYEKTMPWPKNSKDMEYFKKLTHGSAIVMGRSTAVSMPLPLPYRIPIIVSSSEYGDFSTIDYNEHDVMDTLELAIEQDIINRAVLIGGLTLLTKENLHRCDNIYYTKVKGSFKADTTMDKDIVDWLDSLESEVLYEDEKIKITHAKL